MWFKRKVKHNFVIKPNSIIVESGINDYEITYDIKNIVESNQRLFKLIKCKYDTQDFIDLLDSDEMMIFINRDIGFSQINRIFIFMGVCHVYINDMRYQDITVKSNYIYSKICDYIHMKMMKYNRHVEIMFDYGIK